MSMLDFLYSLRDDDRWPEEARAHYRPPPTFEHGQWATVMTLEKQNGGDGYAVVVDECRMPSRFYRIRTLPSVNSLGEKLKPIRLSTGSSAEELTWHIAEALNNGMLGVAPEEVN